MLQGIAMPPVLGKRALDGNIETFLLMALRQGPSYGYEIVQEINRRSPELLKLGEGTVYPVLHRMEERGLLATEWRTGETKRRRKYYRLTQAGKKALAENLQQWEGLQAVMSAFQNTNQQPKGA